jgi:hypothetical protein
MSVGRATYGSVQDGIPPGESHVHKTSYRRHLDICSLDRFRLFRTRTSPSFAHIYAYALAAPFGISYESAPFTSTTARVVSAHPLTEKLSGLRLIANNGLPISLQPGETLAELGGKAALGLVDYGGVGGEVLILSDLGSLDLYDFRDHEGDSLAFLRNVARYARDR